MFIERSQTQKTTWLHLHELSRKGKSAVIEGEWLQTAVKFLFGEMKCFGISDVIVWSCDCAKKHWILHLTLVNYKVYELYLNF
jgi:hypothetical protein